jgi:alpha-tubulin suppressor-like RCC1 family protein
MAGITTTNFRDSDGVDLGRKLVTKDYLLEVYGSILENSPASGLVVTPELWVWGDGSQARLGNNTSGINAQTKTPVTVFSGGTNWKQVSPGYQHTAAIKTDGSLWIWGRGNEGQLGTNNTTERATPVTTFSGGNDWKQVSCSKYSSAAIKTDGSLWVWGQNNTAQLGTNDTTQRNTPVTTFAGGNDWKQVFMVDPGGGDVHTLSIKTDGSLWTWGANDNGQLGTNNTNARSTPVTTFIGGTTWKSISGGRSISAAIKTDGTLWTWGQNNAVQLGINIGGGNRVTPVTTFAGGNNWKQVSCNGGGGVAIKTDGSLWTWGAGNSGVLGNNDITNRSTPVTTFAGGNNWKQVECGDSHVASIKTDGTLWTWGTNNTPQSGSRLGTNDTTQRNTPVTTFAGGNDWKSVSGGREHTAAIKSIDYI